MAQFHMDVQLRLVNNDLVADLDDEQGRKQITKVMLRSAGLKEWSINRMERLLGHSFIEDTCNPHTGGNGPIPENTGNTDAHNEEDGAQHEEDAQPAGEKPKRAQRKSDFESCPSVPWLEQVHAIVPLITQSSFWCLSRCLVHAEHFGL
jgi:hypothetical protein